MRHGHMNNAGAFAFAPPASRFMDLSGRSVLVRFFASTPAPEPVSRPGFVNNVHCMEAGSPHMALHHCPLLLNTRYCASRYMAPRQAHAVNGAIYHTLLHVDLTWIQSMAL
jgi:hypothetical protein